MKPPLSDIKTRTQFQEVLRRTRDEMRTRVKTESAYPLWPSILAQLEAMETWTAGGRVPTKEERDRIVMGLMASRELEPASDLALYDLSQRLQELQYYFQVHL